MNTLKLIVFSDILWSLRDDMRDGKLGRSDSLHKISIFSQTRNHDLLLDVELIGNRAASSACNARPHILKL